MTHFLGLPGHATTQQLHGGSGLTEHWSKTASVRFDSLLCKTLSITQWLGIPNHCSWSAHCAASLSLPSRSPSSPLPSMSSPSSSTVASAGLSSFSIFCIPSKDFWSLGSRLEGEENTHSSSEKRTFNRVVSSECSPECYAVLIHGFLVIIDSHQEIPQHPVQDTVALIGQGATKERDPFFILLFPTFMRNRPAEAYVAMESTRHLCNVYILSSSAIFTTALV